MAAHRYWRVIGLESYNGVDLEITEFQLLDGLTRVDASATLTSNTAPTTGSLANLKDDDTATGAAWNAAAFNGLVLSWDFGSATNVTDIRIGAATSIANFLLGAVLQYSDDAVAWTTQAPALMGIAWPGARTKTSSDVFGAWNRGQHYGAVTLASSGTIALQTPGSNAPARPAVVPKRSGTLQIEWEWITTTLAGANAYVGFTEFGELVDPSNGRLGYTSRGWSYGNNGAKTNAGSDTAYGASYVVGDVLGAVVDFAAGSITFYKNGVSQGVAFTGITFADLYPGAKIGSTGFTWQTRVRTKNFTYPVGGATAWEDRETLIAQNTVRGRTPYKGAIGVAGGSSVVLPYGQTRTAFVARGRNDFASGVLGLGIGRIAATVKVDATPTDLPVVRRVRLYRMRDGALVRELWSNVDGTFSFDYIDELQRYYVISFDHNDAFRAVIADNLTPSLIA